MCIWDFKNLDQVARLRACAGTFHEMKPTRDASAQRSDHISKYHIRYRFRVYDLDNSEQG